MIVNDLITQNELVSIIDNLHRTTTKNIIVAIDGRCASGKTTLGNNLAEYFGANLFHADEFFLRPEQRVSERINTPGGNFDVERFYSEIITGILSEKDFSYSPFDCKTMTIGEEIRVLSKGLNIIEGSYSCHPDIRNNYDITVFVSTKPETQKQRIIIRNKDKAPMFFAKWIPLEEKYFSYFDIKNHCDYIIET